MNEDLRSFVEGVKYIMKELDIGSPMEAMTAYQTYINELGVRADPVARRSYMDEIERMMKESNNELADRLTEEEE